MFSPQTCFIMPSPPCSPSITIASFKSAFHPWDSEEELPFRVTNEMSGTRNYLLQIQYAIIYLFIEKLLQLYHLPPTTKKDVYHVTK